MAQLHPENSPDESVKCEAYGTVNNNRIRITLPPPKDLILGFILALAFIMSLVSHLEARDAYTKAWLAEDQLNKFMTNQEPDLKSRIQVAEELIKAYGLEEKLNERRNNHQQDSIAAGHH